VDAPQHKPGCVLDPVYWLRHAIAAAGMLVHPLEGDPERGDEDRVSAEMLTDALAHFAELPDWASVTLQDIALYATPMNREPFNQTCTCGATA
jgi:hypothetical protein